MRLNDGSQTCSEAHQPRRHYRFLFQVLLMSITQPIRFPDEREARNERKSSGRALRAYHIVEVPLGRLDLRPVREGLNARSLMFRKVDGRSSFFLFFHERVRVVAHCSVGKAPHSPPVSEGVQCWLHDRIWVVPLLPPPPAPWEGATTARAMSDEAEVGKMNSVCTPPVHKFHSWQKMINCRWRIVGWRPGSLSFLSHQFPGSLTSEQTARVMGPLIILSTV